MEVGLAAALEEVAAFEIRAMRLHALGLSPTHHRALIVAERWYERLGQASADDGLQPWGLSEAHVEGVLPDGQAVMSRDDRDVHDQPIPASSDLAGDEGVDAQELPRRGRIAGV